LPRRPDGICIVGCGGYAKAHARAFRSLPGTRLFFSSRSKSRAKRFAKDWNATAAGSFEEALKNPLIDGFVLSSPHDLHLPQAIDAFSNGKGILVEKPIARTVLEARKMMAIAERKNLPFMVAENYAVLPQLASLLIRLKRGDLGPVMGADAISWRPFHPWDWRLNKKRMGGGILIDIGVHIIRFFQVAFGPVARVRSLHAECTVPGMQGESDIEVELAHASGVRSRLDLSWSRPRILARSGVGRPDERTERIIVHGKKRSHVLDLIDDGTSRERAARAIARGFVSHLRGARPLVSPAEGLWDVAVVEAAYRSVERGNKWQPVRP